MSAQSSSTAAADVVQSAAVAAGCDFLFLRLDLLLGVSCQLYELDHGDFMDKVLRNQDTPKGMELQWGSREVQLCFHQARDPTKKTVVSVARTQRTHW